MWMVGTSPAMTQEIAASGSLQGLVIPDCRPAASPESIITAAAVMDSGFLTELVVAPATSGRTRWLGPGMTSKFYVTDILTHVPVMVTLAPNLAQSDATRQA